MIHAQSVHSQWLTNISNKFPCARVCLCQQSSEYIFGLRCNCSNSTDAVKCAIDQSTELSGKTTLFIFRWRRALGTQSRLIQTSRVICNPFNVSNFRSARARALSAAVARLSWGNNSNLCSRTDLMQQFYIHGCVIARNYVQYIYGKPRLLFKDSMTV